MLKLTLRPLITDPQTLIDQGFSPTLARIFAARGISCADELSTDIAGLLPPKNLMGLDTAVSLLDAAIDRQIPILIVGDFDCDGATSTALMMRVLGGMGANVEFLVPDRFKYGYGLTPEIVDLGFELYQPKLIVTVDNGISSHEGVKRAHELGMQVIITDHHLTTKPKPPAEAVVNPNQLGCEFSSKSLAGVGVAFYVLASLSKVRKKAGKSFAPVAKHLDLVALGTVADVAVLDGNNRTLVAQGLAQINAGHACSGIKAILSVASRLGSALQAQDLGFILGPRINAAGRMDNMRIGIECLLCDDWGKALEYARQLEKLNVERRSVEGKMRDEAEHKLATLPELDNQVQDKKSIVLYEPSWHQGVIGIVAGRLKDAYHKPTIVFAPAELDDGADVEPQDYGTQMLKGSARSIAGIHIRDAIEKMAQDNPELITHFGGHAMAAGLSLEAKKVAAFTQAFEMVVAAHDESVFSPVSHTDGVLDAREFTLDFAGKLADLTPWGTGFALPVFDGEFEVANQKVLKEKHLKLQLVHPNASGGGNGNNYIDAIWFNYDATKLSDDMTKVHVLYELSVNEYRGVKRLQLMVRDMAGI